MKDRVTWKNRVGISGKALKKQLNTFESNNSQEYCVRQQLKLVKLIVGVIFVTTCLHNNINYKQIWGYLGSSVT